MSRENLFRINLEDESIIDHEEFILRRVSEETAAKGKALNKRLSSLISKSVGKSLLLYLIPILSLTGAVLLLMRAVVGVFETGTLSIPFALVSLALFFVAGVTYAIYRKHEKREESDEDTAALGDEYGDYAEVVKRELGVPATAKSVDIFTRMYSRNSSENGDAYTNDTAEIFEEDGRLCFLYGNAVVAVPISAVDAVVKVDARITFDSWNKDIRHDRGDYLQYKIQMRESKDGEETYSMEGYYSLRFVHLDRPFEILVPLYDIAPFLEILKAEPTAE